MIVGKFVFVCKGSKGISAFNRNKLLRLEIVRGTNLTFNINEFIFVIIGSKHIYYSLSMTHKITSVLLGIICLKTLTRISSIGYIILNKFFLSHKSIIEWKKLSCSEYPHSPPHLHEKPELSLRSTQSYSKLRVQ